MIGVTVNMSLKWEDMVLENMVIIVNVSY